MKLSELEPRWFVLEPGGPVVGIGFQCPHCQVERLAVLFHHSGAQQAKEDGYIRAHYANDQSRYIWTLTSGSSFDDLTLEPSIDTSKAGHWHGFIRNGEIA